MACDHSNAQQQTVSGCGEMDEIDCCEDDIQTILICPDCGYIKAVNYQLCAECCQGNEGAESFGQNASTNGVIPETFMQHDTKYSTIATNGVVKQSSPIYIKYNNQGNNALSLVYPIGSVSHNPNVAALVGGTGTVEDNSKYWVRAQIPAGTSYSPLATPMITSLNLNVTNNDTNETYFSLATKGGKINNLSCRYFVGGNIFINSVSGNRSHGQFFIYKHDESGNAKLDDTTCLGGVDSSIGNIGADGRTVTINGIIPSPSSLNNSYSLVLQSTNSTRQPNIAISSGSRIKCTPLIPQFSYKRIA